MSGSCCCWGSYTISLVMGSRITQGQATGSGSARAHANMFAGPSRLHIVETEVRRWLSRTLVMEPGGDAPTSKTRDRRKNVVFPRPRLHDPSRFQNAAPAVLPTVTWTRGGAPVACDGPVHLY